MIPHDFRPPELPTLVGCWAFTAEKGWHLGTVDLSALLECDEEAGPANVQRVARRRPVRSKVPVDAMLRDYAAGMKQVEIARKYGVSQPTVSRWCGLRRADRVAVS